MVDNKCSIIANPKGKTWGLACRIHEYILNKKGIEFELRKIDSHSKKYSFRDGEIKPKIEKDIRKRDCFLIHDSNLEPFRWFTELCLVNHALKNSSAHEIIDVFPYLRFARQDVKDESRVPIGAQVVADVVGLYADRVLTLDVHNPAIQGFYKIPFDGLDSHPVLESHLNKYNPGILEDLIVMSADEGGIKRARNCADKLGITDLAMGDKYRKVPGEVGGSLGILGNVEGKNVLMVDDMWDSGGTSKDAAKSCKDHGAKKVIVYCTHGLFTKGFEGIDKYIDKLYIGDTLKIPENDFIETISFAPLLGEAIYRISIGESLSELFD
ncbi:ribose-phosphate diphosphokinase [archaeon]|jgi:ribose-phosphate pyrophosphokinase|nr:ribose-phosphate diphosphokinase [archaeon]